MIHFCGNGLMSYDSFNSYIALKSSIESKVILGNCLQITQESLINLHCMDGLLQNLRSRKSLIKNNFKWSFELKTFSFRLKIIL